MVSLRHFFNVFKALILFFKFISIEKINYNWFHTTAQTSLQSLHGHLFYTWGLKKKTLNPYKHRIVWKQAWNVEWQEA